MPFTLWPFQRRTPPVEKPAPLPLATLDEDGRRHRNDVPYLLPKDEQELQRLDYQHYLFRHLLRGNTFAPVGAFLKRGCNVLDVGCGTGRWGHEIATTYPHTSVYGFDLEDVPRSTSTPRNSQFYRGNVLLGLPFAASQFQYVHQRVLVAGIPLTKWPSVMGELRRVTAPGGWVELIEMGTTFHQAGPATKQFLQWWAAISQTRGIDASKVAGIADMVKQGGYTNVQAKIQTVPVGNWGGRVGNLLALDILAGWPSMRPLVHASLGVSPELFDSVIAQLREEWNTYRTTYEVYFACGQV